MRREHLAINIELAQLLSKPLAGLFALDVRRSWSVRSHDGAFIRQISLLKHLKKATGRIDAAGNEHRIAVTTLQPVAHFHINQNVCDDLLQTIL